MIIEPEDSMIIPELVHKFKVLNVHYEPHSESFWKIQYKNYAPFGVTDKGFSTLKEDEKAIEINAQINLDVENVLPTSVKKKAIVGSGGEFWGTVTGIYTDTIKVRIGEAVFFSYIVDSIFPLRVTKMPAEAKIGDWVTLEGELMLDLPRQKSKTSLRN